MMNSNRVIDLRSREQEYVFPIDKKSGEEILWVIKMNFHIDLIVNSRSNNREVGSDLQKRIPSNDHSY